MRIRLLIFLMLFPLVMLKAQVGEHRNEFAVGFNGGYALSNVGFVPKVSQTMLGDVTGGLTMRYVCEKYFKTICSVQAEVNYTRTGWKERIWDIHDAPCINTITGLPEAYQREITYVQVPVFAHLAWGKEHKGAQFFFQVGPQVGYMLSEKTSSNFNYEDALLTDPERVNHTIAQDSMAVENKFDYGIAAGLGMEVAVGRLGHLQIEGRYYYGLGNIYGDSKKDYFSKSNFSSIILKIAWLFRL